MNKLNADCLYANVFLRELCCQKKQNDSCKKNKFPSLSLQFCQYNSAPVCVFRQIFTQQFNIHNFHVDIRIILRLLGRFRIYCFLSFPCISTRITTACNSMYLLSMNQN